PEPLGARTGTDREGRFRVRLEAGALVSIKVTAASFAPATFLDFQAGERARLVLHAPVALDVSVLDGRRNPVAGVRVVTKDDRAARTDDRGVASFESMPAGAFVRLDVEDADHANPLGNFNVTLASTGRTSYEIELPDGYVLTGQVVDAETDAPIADAELGYVWTMDATTRTDDVGRFRINGWMGKNVYHALHVRAPGYTRAAKVIQDWSKPVEFRLVRGDTAVGRVVGAKGVPVAGAAIAAVLDHRVEFDTQYATSGPGGRFELADLSRSGPHTLTVIARGHGKKQLVFKPHPKERGRIDLNDIELAVERTIAGRVESADGEPEARVEVELTSTAVDYSRAPVSVVQYPHGAEETRYTDDLGRFTFPGQSPGEFRIRVRRRGMPEVKQTVTVAEHDVRDLKLRLPPGRMFTVTLLDEAGGVPPRARIRVNHAGGASSAWTDAQGHAEVWVQGEVKSIEEPLWFAASGQVPPYLDEGQVTDVPAGATTYTLRLRRGVRIAGIVRDAEGNPIPMPLIRIFQGADEWHARYNRDGTFHALVAAATPCRLELYGRHVNPEPHAYQVRNDVEGRWDGIAPGTERLELTARRIRMDRELTVRVVDENGKPVPHVSVGAGQVVGATGPDGVTKIAGLPHAPLTVKVLLSAALRHGIPAPLRIDATAKDVTLTMVTVDPIRGRVVTDPATGAGVRVSAARDGIFVAHATTKPDGSFEIFVTGTEPVHVQATVRLADKPRRLQARNVRPGGTVELTVGSN
ncbi:MAG: carboxypeptidase-like regulatory domain-containing protein, partial [Planctomycetota bacterium]|nr:carboxypeptidase-like regulatory domain-containing protein [Planctomycetota bacterium]